MKQTLVPLRPLAQLPAPQREDVSVPWATAPQPRPAGRRYAPRHTARAVASAQGLPWAGQRRIARAGAGAAIGALAVGGVSAGQLAHPARAEATTADLVQVSAAQRTADLQKLLDLVNAHRAAHGLGAVKYSARLSQIVQTHSETLVARETVYHSSTFLTDTRAGAYTSAHEIIALSYQADVAQLVAWWKSSPAHNAAMLDPSAQVIGIGLAYADGSLATTGQPWKILSTINLYGYANGGAPSDASAKVSGATSSTVQAYSAYSTQGRIGAAYAALGGAAVFGAPTMNEAPSKLGGRYQRFSLNGRSTKFLWTAATGAHFVKEYGAIGAAWSRNGHESGYGFPTTDEYRSGNEVLQRFSHGYTLAWNRTTGAVRVFRS